MLSSIITSSSISLFLILFFSFIPHIQSGRIVKVDELCKQIESPKFCSDVLNSMPGGAEGKDLVTVAEYTANVARTNLSGIIVLLKSLIKNTTNPESKPHYKLRYSIYSEGVARGLDDTKKSLKNGDYLDVSIIGSVVLTLSDECADDSPGDKSPLVKSNADLWYFGDMILIIGDLLQNH